MSKDSNFMAKEAGYDDLGDVGSVGTAAAHHAHHHSRLSQTTEKGRGRSRGG